MGTEHIGGFCPLNYGNIVECTFNKKSFNLAIYEKAFIVSYATTRIKCSNSSCAYSTAEG